MGAALLEVPRCFLPGRPASLHRQPPLPRKILSACHFLSVNSLASRHAMVRTTAANSSAKEHGRWEQVRDESLAPEAQCFPGWKKGLLPPPPRA
jgi:hypothetical protein